MRVIEPALLKPWIKGYSGCPSWNIGFQSSVAFIPVECSPCACGVEQPRSVTLLGMNKCLPIGVLDIFQSGNRPALHGNRGKMDEEGEDHTPLILEDMSLFYYRQLATSLHVSIGFIGVYNFEDCFEMCSCRCIIIIPLQHGNAISLASLVVNIIW